MANTKRVISVVSESITKRVPQRVLSSKILTDGGMIITTEGGDPLVTEDISYGLIDLSTKRVLSAPSLSITKRIA